MSTGPRQPRGSQPCTPLHAQEVPPRLVIVVYGPVSRLLDVPAIHTIEMIPKSMILPAACAVGIFIPTCHMKCEARIHWLLNENFMDLFIRISQIQVPWIIKSCGIVSYIFRSLTCIEYIMYVKRSWYLMSELFPCPTSTSDLLLPSSVARNNW